MQAHVSASPEQSPCASPCALLITCLVFLFSLASRVSPAVLAVVTVPPWRCCFLARRPAMILSRPPLSVNVCGHVHRILSGVTRDQWKCAEENYDKASHLLWRSDTIKTACELHVELLSAFYDTQVDAEEFAEALIHIDCENLGVYSKTQHWVKQAAWAMAEGHYFMSMLAQMRYTHGFSLPRGPGGLGGCVEHVPDSLDELDDFESHKSKKYKAASVSQLYADPVVNGSGNSPGASGSNGKCFPKGKGRGKGALRKSPPNDRDSPLGNPLDYPCTPPGPVARCEDDDEESELCDGPPESPPSKYEHPDAFAIIPPAARPDPEAPGGKHSYTIRHPASLCTINVLVKARSFYVKSPVNCEDNLHLDAKGGHHISWGKDIDASWLRASKLAGWPATTGREK